MPSFSEAGFEKGPDGMLSKNGEPFEFTVLLSQGNDVRIKCAELIQKRLSEIGIVMKIRVIEWAAFINDFIDKKKFRGSDTRVDHPAGSRPFRYLALLEAGQEGT